MAGRKYDRIVQVLRKTTTRGALNKPVDTWPLLTRVMASQTPVSDGERDRASQVGASRTDRFETWWLPGLAELNPSDYRLRCGGKTYDITGVKEIGYQDRLEITTKARADTSGAG